VALGVAASAPPCFLPALPIRAHALALRCTLTLVTLALATQVLRMTRELLEQSRSNSAPINIVLSMSPFTQAWHPNAHEAQWWPRRQRAQQSALVVPSVSGSRGTAPAVRAACDRVVTSGFTLGASACGRAGSPNEAAYRLSCPAPSTRAALSSAGAEAAPGAAAAAAASLVATGADGSSCRSGCGRLGKGVARTCVAAQPMIAHCL
jgi:hypothetical protein